MKQLWPGVANVAQALRRLDSCASEHGEVLRSYYSRSVN